ncbi:MAG: protein phosphatase 2C domain-containing protein [Clostridiales bacterium]|nr:protein phosphatase 2C domain-containing protein [Clostridiales bacterium]
MDRSKQLPQVEVTMVSRVGQRHFMRGEPGDDAVYVYESSHSDFVFCGVADGQSGMSHSLTGARESLLVAANYLEKAGITSLMQYPYSDEIQFGFIRRIRERIDLLAKQYGVGRDAFSSTLLGIALEKKSGNYVLAHLGGGCGIGVLRDGTMKIISAPDTGVSAQYTWLTTSPQALSHLRIYFGNLQNYRRILLMTDGADCICKGRNIQRRAREILLSRNPEDIRTYMEKFVAVDDASCIMIDGNREESS